jgi:hypothetical protein
MICKVLLLAAVALLCGCIAYVALALWVDDRNQRFYVVNEPRNWAG